MSRPFVVVLFQTLAGVCIGIHFDSGLLGLATFAALNVLTTPVSS